MVLCWVTTLLVLPTVLVLSERVSSSTKSGGFRAYLAGHCGRPFAWLATGSPRAVVAGAVLLTVVSGVPAFRYVERDPIEYNMRTVDNAATDRPTEVRRLSKIADRIVGRLRQDGLALGVQPIGIADLPEQMAQPFTEKNGRRGFTPRALLASLASTLIIVWLTFRGRREALWVIASVLVGFVWTIGVLAVWNSTWVPGKGLSIDGMRINFLNFVALPITLGVGVDYSVNVMQRYRLIGGDMRRVIIETGGAVVLCSLTTLVSYLSLTLSINGAIRSFGIAAAAGEVCCMLTGVFVLPAVLCLLRGPRAGSAGRARSSRP